ncbi:MAG: bifunctional phosphopantothenoylcysteine decarboxylase/phosphopantothenate--cysteine ligase CoaBC [Atopobiaceae bacterium]|jgi:phosphopantothenoylcysteine decarboxylase/phosphopantothenate--cysteine ligase
MSKSDEGEKLRALVVVTGGIAAYKAAEVVRGLQKKDFDVWVVMTQAAQKFVGPATFEGLTRRGVATDEFTAPDSSMRIPHIDLSAWADVVVVVPATANIMAKMATGIADDLASSTLLAVPRETPLVVAPAMNVRMWQNAATQENRACLRERGIRFVEPVEGRLACGDIGEGKLASVEDIVEATAQAAGCQGALPAQDLLGKKILVTAGPTHEAIDPVRYIANRSSGKMGYAIARAAAARGADVVLVTGPTQLDAPRGVSCVSVESAQQMFEAARDAFTDADAAILAAAVADYTPAHVADHKLKKSRERLDTIELVETTDILATLSRTKGARVVVGFAAETDHVLENARAKLERKGCDLIVANQVGGENSAFGSESDEVSFVSPESTETLPRMSKAAVADALMDRIVALMGEQSAR